LDDFFPLLLFVIIISFFSHINVSGKNRSFFNKNHGLEVATYAKLGETEYSFKIKDLAFIMKCPFCGNQENKVVDSRLSYNGDLTRRRRECLGCNARFTTYERVEELMPLVVKKDGRREAFAREKILEGIRKACQKRSFAANDFEEMTREVEIKIQSMGVKELNAQAIGQMVMAILRNRDKVAYIRFASVYREFQDVEEFVAELRESGYSATSQEQNKNENTSIPFLDS